jgi:zeta-carotene desaturase
MQKATIVGAGVAGMSAALRLLERGFHVTMFEQDDFVGGMLHSYWDEETQSQREHGYHMFPNFYFNFWKIAEELGLQQNFTPREALRFLTDRNLKNLPAMYNPGGPQDFVRNLLGGAEAPPDFFIYMYSLIDILAQSEGRHAELDDVSVTGFLQGRPYMTAAAMQLHETVWETVWGISSDQASLRSYRTFLKYSNRYSVPEFWFLAGNKWDHLIGPWLDRLQSHGDRFELKLLQRLERVHVDSASKRVTALEFVAVDRSPTVNPVEPGKWSKVGEPYEVDVSDDAVILSVTPGSITRLVRDELYSAAPSLGEVRYLSADPMGDLQLYLTRRLVGVPSDVTEFPDCPYSLTFLDFTQLWPDQHNTLLNVSVSDVTSLLSVPAERRDDNHELLLDLTAPTTAIEYVLAEVLQRLPITLADIDLRRTAFDLNSGEELFANMAGSWAHRPDTNTPLLNLWLAGTYVKNFIDVATIEGAVITGSMAAEAIRVDRAPNEPPIKILEPEAFPVQMFQALRIAWAPLVALAKLWSAGNRMFGRSGRSWAIAQQQFIAAGANAVRPYLGRVPNPPEYLGPLNWTVAARNLPANDPLAIGPIYWLYNSDGTRKH